MGPNYKHGKIEDLFEKPIQKQYWWCPIKLNTYLMFSYDKMVGLVGMDDVLLNSGIDSSNRYKYISDHQNVI